MPEMRSLGPHFKLRIKSWKVEVPWSRRELLAEADVSSSLKTMAHSRGRGEDERVYLETLYIIVFFYPIEAEPGMCLE